MDYSVLMSVYAKEEPLYLEQSITSMLNQTLPTNDFVIVCDGPLTKSLEEVIERFYSKYSNLFNIIKLDKNGGLGKALNIGLGACRNNLIARMDSDDISLLNRCALQVEYFKKFPKCSIISGFLNEMDESMVELLAVKVVPETMDDIKKYLVKRNPINHPCVMFKKDAVIKAGGYQDYYLLEDYFLWIRMFQSGCEAYNIQKPLLLMRSGDGLYYRRSGFEYVKSIISLRSYMLKNGIINFGQFFYLSFIHSMVALLPNYIRKKFYYIFLREYNRK